MLIKRTVGQDYRRRIEKEITNNRVEFEENGIIVDSKGWIIVTADWEAEVANWKAIRINLIQIKKVGPISKLNSRKIGYTTK